MKAEKLKGMRSIGMDAVKAMAATEKLKPTRDDFKDKPGYWERPKEGGGFEWGCKMRHAEAAEAMMPFARADVARVAAANGFPGDYGGGIPGKVMLPPRAIAGEWCPTCDRLNVWCDCEAANAQERQV